MFVLQNDECITGKSSCNAELEVLSFMFLYKVILAVLKKYNFILSWVNKAMALKPESWWVKSNGQLLVQG